MSDLGRIYLTLRRDENETVWDRTKIKGEKAEELPDVDMYHIFYSYMDATARQMKISFLTYIVIKNIIQM